MEILGVGPMELIFILIIALIVLGPEDMAKAGRTVGRTLRKIVMSPTWHAVQQTSREIRTLPNRLMREAGLDEIEKELNVVKDTQQALRKDFDQLRQTSRRSRAAPAAPDAEQNTILPSFGAWTRSPAETGPAPSARPETEPPDEPKPANE